MRFRQIKLIVNIYSHPFFEYFQRLILITTTKIDLLVGSNNLTSFSFSIKHNLRFDFVGNNNSLLKRKQCSLSFFITKISNLFVFFFNSQMNFHPVKNKLNFFQPIKIYFFFKFEQVGDEILSNLTEKKIGASNFACRSIEETNDN